MNKDKKPTARQLRDLAVELKLTAEKLGCTVDTACRRALASDDPVAYLRLLAGEPEAAAAPAENGGPRAEPHAPQATAPVEPGQLVREYAITMPAVELPEALSSHLVHLEVRLNTGEQARGFHRLWLALLAQSARLNTSRPVYTRADVLRWIVEQLDKAWEEGDAKDEG